MQTCNDCALYVVMKTIALLVGRLLGNGTKLSMQNPAMWAEAAALELVERPSAEAWASCGCVRHVQEAEAV